MKLNGFKFFEVPVFYKVKRILFGLPLTTLQILIPDQIIEHLSQIDHIQHMQYKQNLSNCVNIKTGTRFQICFIHFPLKGCI